MAENELAVIDVQTQGLTVPESVAHTMEHVKFVQQVMRSAMKDGIHYGASFPGDKKKNLLKPGADMLCVAFHLAPEFTITTTDLGGGHREYTVTCQMRTQERGLLIGSGVGSASTLESKHRYRNAALKCPTCGKEGTIIKGKSEYGGGWVCFEKKGGCKAKFNDGDERIEKQERGKVENPDPADQWNTCLKMAKKRAFVDCAITATAASDLFSQDAEDHGHGEIVEAPPVQHQPESNPTPDPAPNPIGTKLSQVEELEKMLAMAANTNEAAKALSSWKKQTLTEDQLNAGMAAYTKACQAIERNAKNKP